MLVLQKAVYIAENGLPVDPLIPLVEMLERFITLNNNTPLTWALSLRSFGKPIHNSTTSLGHIYWLDDAQTVLYYSLEVSIPGFRQFVYQ